MPVSHIPILNALHKGKESKARPGASPPHPRATAKGMDSAIQNPVWGLFYHDRGGKVLLGDKNILRLILYLYIHIHYCPKWLLDKRHKNFYK